MGTEYRLITAIEERNLTKRARFVNWVMDKETFLGVVWTANTRHSLLRLSPPFESLVIKPRGWKEISVVNEGREEFYWDRNKIGALLPPEEEKILSLTSGEQGRIMKAGTDLERAIVARINVRGALDNLNLANPMADLQSGEFFNLWWMGYVRRISGELAQLAG